MGSLIDTRKYHGPLEDESNWKERFPSASITRAGNEAFAELSQVYARSATSGSELHRSASRERALAASQKRTIAGVQTKTVAAFEKILALMEREKDRLVPWEQLHKTASLEHKPE